MILIIGGAGQGKLDYVLQKTGYGPAQVARTPEEARTRPVFAGLEDWPELDEAALLEANPDVILICDEVGCGVMLGGSLPAGAPGGGGRLAAAWRSGQSGWSASSAACPWY